MDPLYLALLLFVAAIVLAFIDLFIPSGGMLLVVACAAALASVLFGFRASTTMGMAMLTLVAASVPTFAFVAIKIWPNTPIGKRIILNLPVAPDRENAIEVESLESMIGFVLLADYPLMPSGQLRVGHRHYNAVAESGMIEAGQNVEVISVKERNLVVRQTDTVRTRIVSDRVDLADSPPENLLDLPAEELGIDSIDD